MNKEKLIRLKAGGQLATVELGGTRGKKKGLLLAEQHLTRKGGRLNVKLFLSLGPKLQGDQ